MSDAGNARDLVLRLPSDAAIRVGVLLVLAAATAADLLLALVPSATRGSDELYRCFVRGGYLTTGTVVPAESFSGCFGATASRLTGEVAVGLAVLAVAVTAAYLLHPRLLAYRRGLVPLRAVDHPELARFLRDLVAETGLRRAPAFLVDPAGRRPLGLAFGVFRRYRISLSAGLLTLWTTDRDRFRAVVLHELAHVRNGDIAATYLAVVVWRVFVGLLLVPWLVLGVMNGVGGVGPPIWDNMSGAVWWRIGVLLVLVFLARNAVLRAREVAADLRTETWDPDAAEHLRTAAAHGGTSPRWWRPAAAMTHPRPHHRLAAMRDPATVLRPSAWDAALAGLGVALAVQHLAGPLHLLRISDAWLLTFGLLTVFAVPLGGLVALLGWRTAAYARFRPGTTGLGRISLVAVALGVGLLPGHWLTFLNPQLPNAGVAGLLVHAAPVAVIAFAVLWAYADAGRRLAAGPVDRRLRAPVVTTFGVSTVLVAGWAGWWSDPTWRDDLPAVVDLARDHVDGVIGVLVTVPSAVLAREPLAQLAAVLIWLVPALGLAGRPRWSPATVRSATLGAASAAGLVLLIGIAAGYPGSFAGQAFLIAVTQAFVAVTFYRRRPGGVLPALYAGYLTGALAVAAVAPGMLVGSCLPWRGVCGTVPTGYAAGRLLLTVTIVGTIATGLSLVVARFVPGARRTRPAPSAKPWPARLVPAGLAVLALVAVGFAVPAVDRVLERAPQPGPGQGPVVSLPRPVESDPAVIAAGTRAWIREGGGEVLDSLDEAADALGDAGLGNAPPSVVAAACRRLRTEAAEARRMPPPPGPAAGPRWAEAFERFDRAVQGCELEAATGVMPLRRRWVDDAVQGRVSLTLVRLTVIGAVN